MAENLNYNVAGSRCYNDDESYCDTYGRLYDWSTAMALSSTCNSSTCSGQVQTKHRGICPSVWHIPSDAECDIRVQYVDTKWTSMTDGNVAGTKLKAISGWNDYSSSSGNGTDDYGFAALPGGYGSSVGFFNNAGGYGYWWSASEYNAFDAYTRRMYYEYAYRANGGKPTLYSVRCLQD
jgi:uncharacterized protein (TIGR02145 family)